MTTPEFPKPKRILLIEDSITLRGGLRRALEKQMPHCEIAEAADGKEALASMTRKKVDLIITDLEMPGMDGPAFLRLLKGNPVLSKKPIVVFSSRITPELKIEMENLPFIRYIPKSSKPEEILQEAIGLLAATHPLRFQRPRDEKEEVFPGEKAGSVES